jgi:hypothetical protein
MTVQLLMPMTMNQMAMNTIRDTIRHRRECIKITAINEQNQRTQTDEDRTSDNRITQVRGQRESWV